VAKDEEEKITLKSIDEKLTKFDARLSILEAEKPGVKTSPENKIKMIYARMGLKGKQIPVEGRKYIFKTKDEAGNQVIEKLQFEGKDTRHDRVLEVKVIGFTHDHLNIQKLNMSYDPDTGMPEWDKETTTLSIKGWDKFVKTRGLIMKD